MPPDAPFSVCVARLMEEAPALLDVALRTGGGYADLFYEHTTTHRLSWTQRARPRAVDPPRRRTGAQTVTGVGLHVLGDGRVGFAASGDLSPRSLRDTASEAALRLGQIGGARRAQRPRREAAPPAPPMDAPDAIAPSEKLAFVEAAAAAALSLDTWVERVVVTYHDRVRRILVATSEGVFHTALSMDVGFRVEVVRVAADGKRTTAQAVAGGPRGVAVFVHHPVEAVAREAVERARRRTEAQPFSGGPMPVVLAAGWGGAWLHEAVGHLLEADVVASGASPLAGCLGRPVAASTVTLVDDATFPGGRGTQAVDDEGTPAARTPLIEKGVLRAFLTDRHTADRLALPLTGNGRRQDYRRPPLPRMTNLLLEGGSTAPADLLADVADGLYVQEVGHGSVDPGRGFALEVLDGYRIERGRCTTPVKDIRITGAGPDVLHRIVGLGHDLKVDTARGLCEKRGQVVPISVGMPTVLVQAMNVDGIGTGGV